MSLPNNGEDTDRLARRHPVDVAAQRVDLAVVGDQRYGCASYQVGKVLVEKR